MDGHKIFPKGAASNFHSDIIWANFSYPEAKSGLLATYFVRTMLCKSKLMDCLKILPRGSLSVFRSIKNHLTTLQITTSFLWQNGAFTRQSLKFLRKPKNFTPRFVHISISLTTRKACQEMSKNVRKNVQKKKVGEKVEKMAKRTPKALWLTGDHWFIVTCDNGCMVVGDHGDLGPLNFRWNPYFWVIFSFFPFLLIDFFENSTFEAWYTLIFANITDLSSKSWIHHWTSQNHDPANQEGPL